MKESVLKLCLSIIITAFFSTIILGQSKTQIDLEKISVIRGTQKNFIGSPVDIAAINDLVFLADAMDMKIKVFTHEGDYVRSFGGRGRGPGEFQHLTNLWIDHKGRIAVVDYFNTRISFFSQGGKLLDEILFKPTDIQWPRHFESINDSNVLIIYSKEANPRKAFHIWNSDLSALEGEFSLPASLNFDDDVKESSLSFSIGSTTVLNGTLYYAPFFYEGNLFAKDISVGTNSTWISFKGLFPEGPSYERLSPNQKLKNEAGENIFDYRINSRRGSVAFRIFHTTRSLFSTSDGFLVHLFEVRDGSLKKQGVQVFSGDGQAIGHTFYNTKLLREDLL